MEIRPTLGTLGGLDTNRQISLAMPILVAVQVEQRCIRRLAGSILAHSRPRLLARSAIFARIHSRRSDTGISISRSSEVSRSWAKDEDLSFVQKRSICLTR